MVLPKGHYCIYKQLFLMVSKRTIIKRALQGAKKYLYWLKTWYDTFIVNTKSKLKSKNDGVCGCGRSPDIHF